MTSYSQLTHADRVTIQSMLDQGLTQAQIAAVLGKSKSTITREIKRHITLEKAIERKAQNGRGVYDCARIPECGSNKGFCNHGCEDQVPIACERRDKKGFCNGCPVKRKPRACKLEKRIYLADEAQMSSDFERRDSRKGICVNSQTLNSVAEIIENGVRKGQSLRVICENHSEIPVSYRTVYNWVEQREFADHGILNIDLPTKMGRKPRRYNVKSNLPLKPRKENRVTKGRTYDDFLKYCQRHPDLSVMEMDTVYNSAAGPVIQTFYSREPHHLFLARYHTEKTAESMISGLRDIRDLIGPKAFRKLFAIILTDRGTEFMGAETIEKEFGIKVFFCDPMASIQKAKVENKHLMLRKILPKGVNLIDLGFTCQRKLDLILSHINSYKVASLNWKTPYEYFVFIYNSSAILDKLNIQRIDPDSVTLTPDLLKKE